MIRVGAEAEKNTRNVITRIDMKEQSDNTKALYAVILATVVGGGLAVFGKIGLQVIPPFTFTLLRFLIGTIFLVPFIGKLRKITFKKIVELGLVSLLSTVNIFLFSFGIRLTTATISQLLYAFVPILVAILSIFLLNKKPSFIQAIGIVVGLIGMVFLIVHPTTSFREILTGSSLGNILIAIGTFLFSLYLIYSKKLQNRYSPATLMAAFIGTTMLMSLPFFLFEVNRGMDWISRIQPITVISLFYVGIIGTGVFYFLNQYAVKHGGPLIASVIQYTQPPATLIWAMILLQEKITLEFIIGAILAYFGAWLITKRM